MSSNLQKLIVLPVAMILSLLAASTSPELVWRGYQPAHVAVR
jgi:hypothetical protein